ncbi:MAG: RNA-directed DNA polymerase [Candidatus Muirbacterium halophilum]|nr:RNA-directed DNA polymerase [Candidatus Muirbacterium halophilum]MCK9475883.1 RNA-directed DNA polymerase [Candidatus Muirbacterium halophilum]
MLKQFYDKDIFLSVIQKEDVRKWNLWNKNENKKEIAENLSKNLRENKFKIEGLIKSCHNSKKTYYPKSPTDFFALKILDKYLRRIYQVKQSDRKRIIRQIKTILKENGDFTLIRTDIKSFYETIDFNSILGKIESDMILSPIGISLLKSLKQTFFYVAKINKGLPRGINVSPTIAELYLRDFDISIKEDVDVIYYARYVDDIFLIVDDSKVNIIENEIKQKIEKIHLEFNDDKIFKNSIKEEFSFSYLGYLFRLTSNNEVELLISPKKINKIKTRIYKSFLDYQHNNNFSLLLDRLRFLSCNKVRKKSENGYLMAGNSYNYCDITDPNCFKVFDGFINKKILNIFSLNDLQKNNIKKISFYRAYKNKINVSFTRRQIGNIKKAWGNE